MSQADRPLRIVHVIHSLGTGGAEKVLTDLARVCRDGGFEMVVVALSPDPEPIHVRVLRDLGIRVHCLERHRWDPRAIAEVTRVLQAEGADVVHTHLKHADIVGGLAAARLGLPHVATLHLIEQPADSLARGKLVLASLVRNARAARIIAVSRAQREWYVRDTRVAPDRVIVLPNGVQDPPPLPVAEREQLRAELIGRGMVGAGVVDHPVIGVMATVMRADKGHGHLFRALKLLPESLPLLVAIAGNGELEDMIRAQVEGDAELGRRVRLLGYRTDVPRLMQAADFVLHPTEDDALPTTLIEAIGCGRASVASAVGGVPDIVVEGTGLLVPPADPPALAEALTTMVTDPGLRERAGANARRHFEVEFDARVWARRLAELYARVIEENRRGPQRDSR